LASTEQNHSENGIKVVTSLDAAAAAADDDDDQQRRPVVKYGVRISQVKP